MAEMKTKDLSLPAFFEQARQIHSEATDSTVDQNKLKRACDRLHQCEVMIDQLGLFSLNEGKEDFSTADLKYLLVPYYLGEITEKIQNSNRLQIVRTSQLHLKVARFKRQKAADSKLQDIKERKEHCSRSMQAAAIATSIEHGEEFIPDDDSEEETEAWLTTLSLALCKVLDLLDGLKKEEELVSCMMETNLQIGQNEVMRTMLEE